MDDRRLAEGRKRSNAGFTSRCATRTPIGGRRSRSRRRAAIAAKLAGDMYRDLRNEAGQSPVQVRIASDDLLRREGGDAAVHRAATDLWQRARATSRDEPPA